MFSVRATRLSFLLSTRAIKFGFYCDVSAFIMPLRAVGLYPMEVTDKFLFNRQSRGPNGSCVSYKAAVSLPSDEGELRFKE